MRLILIFFYCLFSIVSFSQKIHQPHQTEFGACSGKIFIMDNSWFEYPYIYYKDFISTYIHLNFKNNSKYISLNKDGLIKFNTVYSFSSAAKYSGQIGDDSISIFLNFKERLFSFDIKYLDSIQERFITLGDTIPPSTNFHSELKKKIGHDFYGYPDKAKELKINFLSSIRIQNGDDSYEVSDSIFDYMLNPNITESYRSYRPIEVYYSLKTEKFYIYIFGIPCCKDVEDQMKYITGSSYLTKLIVDPYGKEKIRHITVPGGLLGNYGWMECSDFWAF